MNPCPKATKTPRHTRMAASFLPPRLPVDLQIHLFQYLRQTDQGSYLQASRDLRGPLLRSIKHLRIDACLHNGTRSEKALLRLLRGATSLEELVVLQGTLDGPIIVEALTKGTLGHRLRSLSLPWSPKHHTIELLRHLGRGGLPYLQKLDLQHLIRYPDNFGGPVPDSAFSTEMVQAIESRRDRGLSPIIHLCGVDVIYHAHLARILACCPPEHLAYLEASTPTQATVVAEHLRQHVNKGFPCLRKVILMGNGMMLYNPLTHASTSIVGEAIDALVACRPPLLEELEIHHCGPTQGAFTSLGREGLQKGAFPRLKALTLSHTKLHDADFAVLMHGLREPDGPMAVALEGLMLNEVWLSRTNLTLLASALAADNGALRNLRCLDLHVRGEEWGDALLRGLGNGSTPCAQTLHTLSVSGKMLGKLGIAQLVHGLGQGFLPSLAELTLDVDGNDDHGNGTNLMAKLAAAWALQHAHGVTSCLKRLRLQHYSLTVDCLHELTPLFRDGALPQLTALDVRQRGNGCRKDHAALFLCEWTAFGSLIKLEHMTIVACMTSGVRDQFLAAVADPDFCPGLRTLSCPFLCPSDVQHSFQKRLQSARKDTTTS